jgi:hypothetical protein
MDDYDMSDEEDNVPRRKLDKGKGKMIQYELPAELWQRIFQLYYDKVCDGEFSSFSSTVISLHPAASSLANSQPCWDYQHINRGPS